MTDLPLGPSGFPVLGPNGFPALDCGCCTAWYLRRYPGGCGVPNDSTPVIYREADVLAAFPTYTSSTVYAVDGLCYTLDGRINLTPTQVASASWDLHATSEITDGSCIGTPTLSYDFSISLGPGFLCNSEAPQYFDVVERYLGYAASGSFNACYQSMLFNEFWYDRCSYIHTETEEGSVCADYCGGVWDRQTGFRLILTYHTNGTIDIYGEANYGNLTGSLSGAAPGIAHNIPIKFHGTATYFDMSITVEVAP